MAELYSFDVFDTCVTRRYQQPSDLFLELAKQALLSLPDVPTDLQIRKLANARKAAELTARKRSAREDTSIEEIYDVLARRNFAGIDPTAMMQLELDIELASVVAVAPIHRQYRERVNAGGRVIFVSDMYLPRPTVLEMLARCGYDASEENLYLSSHVGLRKRTGALYKYALDVEGVKPNDVLHIGDNYFSDVIMARRTGINAQHTQVALADPRYRDIFLNQTGWRKKTADKLQRASRIYRRFYRPPNSQLPSDRQLALSRTCALGKLMCLDAGNPRVEVAITHFVAAPLFNAYVAWVLEKAMSLGIQKLYFIARNGQIFHRIAEKMCADRDYGIECRYLYGSRSAWYPGSFDTLDERFIDTVTEKYPDLGIQKLFEDLDMPQSSIARLMAALENAFGQHEDLRKPENVRKYLQHIRVSNESSIVETHFRKSRETLIAYLRQEGFMDGSRVAIVDIGWHLSAHNALHKAIQGTGHKGFSGFYFGVGRRHQPAPEACPYYAFVTDEGCRSNSWIFRLGAMQLIEEVFATADHPSTKSYSVVDGTVQPIFSNATGVAVGEAVAATRAGILQFTDRLLSSNSYADMGHIKHESLKQIERLYKYPHPEEARAIANTPVFALTSHSESQRRTLARPIGTGELAGIVLNVLFSNRDISPDWLWLQGSMAMSGRTVYLAGRLLSFLESISVRFRE